MDYGPAERDCECAVSGGAKTELADECETGRAGDERSQN
jgi:hypothetical protein